jgi:hypothetical protein
MSRRRALAAIATTLLLAAPAARAREHAIKLQRPWKVGETCKVFLVAEYRETIRYLREDVPPAVSEEDFRVELAGRMTVTAVDPLGNPRSAEYAIVRCEMFEKGVRMTLVHPGRVLVVERVPRAVAANPDGRKPYRVKDCGELPDKIAAALDAAFDRTVSDVPFDADAVWGSAGRRRAGDAWPMRADAFVRVLGGAGFTVRPEDVEGTARLTGTRRIGPVDCLDVRTEVTAAKVISPPTRDGVTYSGDVRFTSTTSYPVDPARHALKRSSRREERYEGKDAEGTLKMTRVTVRTVSLQPPKTPAGK